MPASPPPAPSAPSSAPYAQASSLLLLLMATACGLCAGLNYINQPLVHSIAAHMQVSEAQAATSVTVSQLSYTLGLLLLVPLGDLLNKRRLIVSLMTLAACGLFLCAWTGHLGLFLLGSACAGVFSVAAQVLIPFSTQLVAPQAAGQAIGILMTGLLIGVQASRVVAGILSAAGWQFVYLVTAALLLLVAAGLWRLLPDAAPAQTPAQTPAKTPSSASAQPTVLVRYLQTMQSMWALFKTQPRLRSRMLLGGLSFAGPAVTFSTMATLLGDAPHHFSEMQIGFVTLVGVASALAAKTVGRRADQGKEPQTTAACVAVLVAVWPFMLLSMYSATVFAVGLLLLGVCLTATHIGSQNVIFGLMPHARSRANAVYMTGYFLGGSFGSAAGIVAWQLGRWPAVCAFGLGIGLLAALALWYDRRLAARA